MLPLRSYNQSHRNMKQKLLLLLCVTLITGCTQANNQNDMEKDSFKTRSGKSVTLTPIKHGSLEINYNGTVFEIDPVGQAVAPATDYAKMAKADFILVTHEHQDHFDKAAIEALTKDNTQLILNRRCFDMMGSGTVMANGDSLQLLPDVMLYAVAAYNTTPGHTQFHPKGRDNGFILQLDGLRIYIAGDTEDIPEMAQIRDIDIALMPCNQPYTMTPEQLHRAAAMVKPKVLYPYHFGNTDTEQMVEATKGMGIDVRLRSFK
ncbi:L-ascorbate metabolism protein UlaG, beta-lactamase superfamily [Prevotella sp. kh1p2]|nr:L-ascorbate metabolism protein UlaG, beta-lactamase superfamily [Prevotella sp. kh1p2]SNU10202.1 L-ascorbate metabolism protein UlaG, beta-lactamase superfamily [Prevotellaceae bacterium KH2P17]